MQNIRLCFQSPVHSSIEPKGCDYFVIFLGESLEGDILFHFIPHIPESADFCMKQYHFNIHMFIIRLYKS